MTDTQNALVIFDQPYTPAALFAPGATDPLLDRIRAEVAKEVTDPSTPAGRKFIVSLAMKVTKTKTAIEANRVRLVGDEKKRLAAIDAEGKRIRESLDELAATVRQPVTDWENRDKARIAAHEEGVAQIKALAESYESLTTDDLARRLAEAQAIDVSGFEEFITIATATKAQVVANLSARLDASQKADADRAELERLRVEKAERDQREREEAIAAKAKAEAEDVARLREEETARAAAAELTMVEREKEEAKAAAEKAERDRIASEEAARLAAENYARKAEQDRIAAEADAKRREEEAAERVRQEIADAKREEEAATARREADKRHRAEVNNAALSALCALGILPVDAKTVIEAIAKGNVPNVKIIY